MPRIDARELLRGLRGFALGLGLGTVLAKLARPNRGRPNTKSRPATPNG